MNIDPNGNAFLSFLIGAAIGAIVGAVSYAVGQVVEYAITKDFEWSWGGFIGSTVGGAVAGALGGLNIPKTLAKIAIPFLGGSVVTAGKMFGENISSDANHSAGRIATSSLKLGFVSVVAVNAMSLFKFKPINAGRGSFSSISKQIYTKLERGIISSISLKTFGKMLASDMYNSLLDIILGGFIN